MLLADGGQGFRTLEDFNIALLAKQLWWLLRFLDSLLARVLKGRYIRYYTLLEIKVSNRPSYGWSSILAVKPLLRSGIRNTIGSGIDTCIWTDPWILDRPVRSPKSLNEDRDSLVYVNTLINLKTKQWIMDRLQKPFLPEEITLILGIKPSCKIMSDAYRWTLVKSDNYSVRSRYWAARALSHLACDHPLQGLSVTILKAQAWKLKPHGN